MTGGSPRAHRGGLRTPPAPWSEHVQVVPFIAKDTVEGQLRLIRMMLDAHFLIMPSRAECFGMRVRRGQRHGPSPPWPAIRAVG